MPELDHVPAVEDGDQPLFPRKSKLTTGHVHMQATRRGVMALDPPDTRDPGHKVGQHMQPSGLAYHLTTARFTKAAVPLEATQVLAEVILHGLHVGVAVGVVSALGLKLEPDVPPIGFGPLVCNEALA